MHMLRTHLRGQLLWKYKVCTLSRVYTCASALLFHCSFNVFEETEGSETEAFSTRFDGGISQFFFVPPTCVIGHFSFFLSRLSTDNQDSIFKAIEALSKRLDSLGTNMERKLDLVNVNVMNMSEKTTALEMKGMHIYIDFQLWKETMKETWASLSNKKMQNEKQVWLNDEHFSYLWLFTLSSQSSLVTSFSYTVKPVLGGHLRKMAGGGGPT